MLWTDIIRIKCTPARPIKTFSPENYQRKDTKWTNKTTVCRSYNFATWIAVRSKWKIQTFVFFFLQTCVVWHECFEKTFFSPLLEDVKVLLLECWLGGLKNIIFFTNWGKKKKGSTGNQNEPFWWQKSTMKKKNLGTALWSRRCNILLVFRKCPVKTPLPFFQRGFIDLSRDESRTDFSITLTRGWGVPLFLRRTNTALPPPPSIRYTVLVSLRSPA